MGGWNRFHREGEFGRVLTVGKKIKVKKKFRVCLGQSTIFFIWGNAPKVLWTASCIGILGADSKTKSPFFCLVNKRVFVVLSCSGIQIVVY